eukprot:710205-Pyramimonas_sp.AAC.1
MLTQQPLRALLRLCTPHCIGALQKSNKPQRLCISLRTRHTTTHLYTIAASTAKRSACTAPPVYITMRAHTCAHQNSRAHRGD